MKGRNTVVAMMAVVLACATYSDRTMEARDAVTRGDYPGAVKGVPHRELHTRKGHEPKKYKSHTALALLERGTVFHAMGRWEDSSRDMQVAERQLELLDIAKDTAGNIGKYIYSDSATKYKQPPSERLALNAINMTNYLARHDLEGARVEASRFAVMFRYLADYDPEHAHGPYGAYMAGFVYERLGERDTAIRWYESSSPGTVRPSLVAPLERLRAGDTKRPTEIVVVVALGRVPYKVPRRIPIGLAIGLAGTWVTGDTKILEHTAFKVVTYPDLEPAQNVLHDAIVSVDGQPVQLELIDQLGIAIEREFDELIPKIIGSAITRMITRALAAEAARAAGNQAEGDAGAVIGLLAAFAVEGTLVALDKPDTRSWTLLPDRFYVARVPVAPGAHHVEVDLRIGDRVAETRRFDVTMAEGDYALLDVTTLR